MDKEAALSVLGFDVERARIHICILSGSRSSPTFIAHECRNFSSKTCVPELMNFFRHTYEEIIKEHHPEAIGYRVAMSHGHSAKSLDQYPYLYFGYGLLNLVAFEREIPIRLFTVMSFNKSFFGQDGSRSELCDNLLGTHPPHWNESARSAALSALGALG